MDKSSDSNRVTRKTEVGMKVVCIDDNFSNATLNVRITFSFPVAITTYTIREVITSSTSADSFFLEEIVNPIVKWPEKYGKATCEPSFFNWRFKPLDLVTAEDEAKELMELEIELAISAVYNEIICDLYLLNIRMKFRYSITSLPSESEVALRGGNGAPFILAKLRTNIKKYDLLQHQKTILLSFIKGLNEDNSNCRVDW